MRLGDDGSLLIISEARSEGGGGLEELIERLNSEMRRKNDHWVFGKERYDLHVRSEGLRYCSNHPGASL